MKRSYYIEKTSKEPYHCIILSTSYKSPMDQLDVLERDLRKQEIKGNILFDLLLSHGNTPDRFYELSFDGVKLNLDSLRKVESVSKEIKMISNKFYRDNQHLLKNSILANHQKFFIRKGVLT
jgi:hypothetical protein